ncbi:energy-coupling factor transporter ATPase [Phosphitispora fastidiosa]|uniref:energy-coupling factor transporter ATPase n=1 Tax=Phosphitispora fastidiosa TaxID=2837202 RepID=UPI001E49F92F|nr:energy-coupling factor transporter ATPase [Phosphitispora fastidiosa]MBU7007432.1 energy-coupling factor transport system ATP-binding protein [Phosphitispora fastidiosa]
MSIEIKNVSYKYSKGTPFARQAIKGIDLRAARGEWLAVMGPTGSGKSTLLQHLNGLLKPDSGEVLLDDKNIHSSAASLREARRKVGLVFQYPEHQLFGASVYEEVAYGPENYGYPQDEITELVQRAMDTVGLGYERYKNRQPYELSGGEKRRVALAGVLAASPEVIVLDEPTAGLDTSGRQLLIGTITRLNRDHGITVIWVTHEITEIAHLADRLVVLNNGEAVITGKTRDVLADPIMSEMGLDIPPAAVISRELRGRGLEVRGQPVTLDEIREEIIRLLKEKQ